MESEKRGETDQDNREYDKSIAIFPNSQFRVFLINKLLLRNTTSTNCKNPSRSLGAADNLLAEKQRISAYKRIKHHIYS